MTGVVVNAKRHGWKTVRLVTFARDGGCISKRRDIFGDDVATDLCRSRDSLGSWAIGDREIAYMEFDHVRDDSGIRVDDEAHGVTVCPWHHRGSGWRSDTKEHRAAERDYLRRQYPEEWRAATTFSAR